MPWAVWEGAEAAVAADDGGDTLQEFLAIKRIAPELHVVMGVSVHEAGGHHEPCRIEVLVGSTNVANFHDLAARYPDVGQPGCAVRAVGDQTIADRQFNHLCCFYVAYAASNTLHSMTISLHYTGRRGRMVEMPSNEEGHNKGSDDDPNAVQKAFERELGDASLVAILRGLTPDATTALALELRSLGVCVIEITIQDQRGLQALRQTVREWPDGPHLIGAGSIISAPLAHQAIEDGAEFLVSPGLSVDVISAARDGGVPMLPGVATPTEVQHAVALGLTAVKLFPAAQLGGPAYLRALSGPFPTMKFVPTGGVSFDNAQSYMAAGALAVGIGGELTQPSGLEALRRWTDGHTP